MVEVPAVTPVINPVVPLIVATPGVALVHTPPITVELNVVVEPTHTVAVPLKVPVLGVALIVTVLVADASAHPEPLTA